MTPFLSRIVLAWSFVAMLLATAATSVSAQEAQGDDRGLRKAQAYLTLAGDLFRSKDYEGALTELRRAAPLVEGSKVEGVVLFNIARCLEELSRFGEAYEAYQRYLDSSEAKGATLIGPEGGRRKKSQGAIERLRASAIGTLRINCEQPGTTLVVRQMGDQPLQCPFERTDLIIGQYDVTASLDAYEPAKKSVAVKAGEVTEVPISLLKKTIVPPPTPPSNPINWAWVGSGLGVAVIGVGFHVAAFQTMDENNEKTVVNTSARDEILDTFRTQRTVAFASYAVAAVLLGVGYYTSMSPNAAGSAGVTVTPSGVQVRF